LAASSSGTVHGGRCQLCPASQSSDAAVRVTPGPEPSGPGFDHR
jgi:hypothetical protein